MKIQRTKDFLAKNIVHDENIKLDTQLHHLGVYSKDNHKLEQPIWVSDNYSCAKQYEHHAKYMNQQIYHSVLQPQKTLRIAKLANVSLLQACLDVGISDHAEWNRVLATALTEMNYDGLEYCNREIHISKPAETLISIFSSIKWE